MSSSYVQHHYRFICYHQETAEEPRTDLRGRGAACWERCSLRKRKEEADKGPLLIWFQVSSVQSAHVVFTEVAFRWVSTQRRTLSHGVLCTAAWTPSRFPSPSSCSHALWESVERNALSVLLWRVTKGNLPAAVPPSATRRAARNNVCSERTKPQRTDPSDFEKLRPQCPPAQPWSATFRPPAPLEPMEEYPSSEATTQ